MNEDIQTVSAALIKKIEKERKPILLPATVATYDQATNLATVTVDGDDTVSTAVSLAGSMGADERVMVQFQPPQGLFVVGHLRGGAGVVGYAETYVAQSGVTTEATINGPLQVTFTAVVGRAYKITGVFHTFQTGGGGGTQTARVRDGAATELAAYDATLANNEYTALVVIRVMTAVTPGSQTWYGTFATSGGTLSAAAAATKPHILLVEDVGYV